jgi:hypothetical protein
LDKHKAQGSEVARILAQIQGEYYASQLGCSGLALGTAQHKFITARMERISELHSELRDWVGENATAMMAQALENSPECSELAQNDTGQLPAIPYSPHTKR